VAADAAAVAAGGVEAQAAEPAATAEAPEAPEVPAAALLWQRVVMMLLPLWRPEKGRISHFCVAAAEGREAPSCRYSTRSPWMMSA
jgi:hypothetical protein